MELFDLSQLSLNSFKEELSKLGDGRFTYEEKGFNILHYALYNFNVDAVLYLLENYPYDLELEMNKKSKEVSFKDRLPFIPINEAFYENNFSLLENSFSSEMFEKYKKVLEILRDNNIYPEILTEDILEKINASGSHGFFLKYLTTEPLLSYYLENKLISGELLLKKIPVLASWNKKGEYIQPPESNVLDKVLSKVEFNFELINKTTFVDILSLDESILHVTPSIYNDFKEKLKSENTIGYNGITNDIFLDKISKISVIDDKDNHHDFFENIEKTLDNIDIKLKNELTITNKIKESLVATLSVSLYLKFKDKYPDVESDNLFIEEIMKRGFLDNKKIKSYDDEKGWDTKRRSAFFDTQVYLPRFNILKEFKHIDSGEMKNYRVSWLYHYIGIIEDRKICETYKNKQNFNLFHNDISVESNAVQKDLNLKIDESIFDLPIQLMAANYYRANLQIEDDSKISENVLLASLFNNKLTFEELEDAIKKIKDNEHFGIKETISAYIEKKPDYFDFLYEESSSFEKIELLKSLNVPEPDFFSTSKILKNCFMNEDEEFIDYSLGKIKSISFNDLKIFFNVLKSYHFYIGKNQGGDLNKEVLFMKNATEDILKIVETHKGQKCLFNEDFKTYLDGCYYLTLGVNKHYDVEQNKNSLIVECLNGIPSFESYWADMEKNIIVSKINQDKNENVLKKRNRI